MRVVKKMVKFLIVAVFGLVSAAVVSKFRGAPTRPTTSPSTTQWPDVPRNPDVSDATPN